MILANVNFGTRQRGEAEQLEDVAESYLASLLHSGQLCGDYFLCWAKGCLNAYVLLAGRGAWELRHHSKYGKKEFKKVVEAFGRRPSWRMLDDKARQPLSTWKGAPFLYLFTHAFRQASPVCRGDGKPPIPLFVLPIPFEQKDDLYSWQRSYYHLDNIWLGSGELEIGAYRQLADPHRELAKRGRELCRVIEAATGVPTFYYLTRYWGRPKGEDQRLCPVCGAVWADQRQPESPWRFWHFAFKCDRCRLVSHMGDSTDGGRHTRIGEFDEKRKAKQTVQRTGTSR